MNPDGSHSDSGDQRAENQQDSMAGAASSSEDEFDISADDYYGAWSEPDVGVEERDIEHYDYECLTVSEAEDFLAKEVDQLDRKLSLRDTATAQVLLHHFKWDQATIVELYQKNAASTLATARIRSSCVSSDNNNEAELCPICYLEMSPGDARSLACGQQFCTECWRRHLETQIERGQSTEISCMSDGCEIVVTVSFVTHILSQKSALLQRYLKFCLDKYVCSHPLLRYCPGNDCQTVVKVEQVQARRVICTSCKTQFCFNCTGEYHAPADCDTIKEWLKKCADDSETAHYIRANTKDCPKCQICIEKDGGCNHVVCSKCKHHFCWVCLEDWSLHGQQYYECSRYRGDTEADASKQAEAREALSKYLFFFARWDVHKQSLRLEEVTRQKIAMRIEEKIKANIGTWIDWQYLQEAADLLAKCRYTLQYTYPYAYYLESGARKDLFLYQQASLENEIENLSWQLERSETTDRGTLGNQMAIAEKRRSALLKDFLSP